MEVKYRTNGEFDFSSYDKKGGYPYPNAYFILVTPKHIKIQKAEELQKGKDFVYLGSHPDFETDKQIIYKAYVTYNSNADTVVQYDFIYDEIEDGVWRFSRFDYFWVRDIAQ